ncbi:MAG TPA: choice-of-anchor Q domain-containing protein, partial [Rhizomicrobium sp.]
NTDPQLDPAGLASNSGPTQTLALCTGAGAHAGCAGASAAINAGDQMVCAAMPVDGLDQRGFVRPGGSNPNCSVGAFEADAGPPVDTPTASQTQTATATSTQTATSTHTGTATATPSQTTTGTATGSQTSTETATQTPTPQAEGSSCTSPSQCQSMFCVDGVCCATACDGPLDQCNLPGQVGTCASVAAPAPTLDWSGLLIGTLVLGAVAALTLRRGRAR